MLEMKQIVRHFRKCSRDDRENKKNAIFQISLIDMSFDARYHYQD